MKPSQAMEERRKRRRANQEAMHERHAEIHDALKAGLSTADIVAAYTRKWHVGERAIHKYLQKCRSDLRAPLTKEQREESHSLVRGWLTEIISEARARKDAKGRAVPDHGIMLKAIDRVCRINGFYFERLEHSGLGGAPIAVATTYDLKGFTDDELAEARRVATRLSSVARSMGAAGGTGR